MTETQTMTELEQQQWVREQYQTATKFLADRGLITKSVADKESRYLIPLMSVWKINLTDNTTVWAISGDLPTDYSPASVAPDAREAVRHFSLKWQLQAENLLKDEKEESKRLANHLISRAEGLYQLFDDNNVWQSS
ncbi:DUF4826 family protein [Thalassotalea sp. 1_MG-2023]|uniref:DUF4826 family protein n=1 Tax=Thalassotalea sp. 1_MG-2023 TaxID=3062680 RepID=UPI0026E40451|nr:DUF4826 family protein [Thalassotalea sp. 1_MG-2023]MDO6428216.1 DUF4826 family protein [Thalassotalea sp. 1_MG-2023]